MFPYVGTRSGRELLVKLLAWCIQHVGSPASSPQHQDKQTTIVGGKKVGSYSTFHFKDTFINEKGFKGTWCNEKYSCISPTWLPSRKSKYHFGMFFVYAGFSKALHGQARPQSPSRAFSIPITVLFVCVVLEMECKASHMLGQYSAVELHPQPLLLAFSIFSISTRPERVLIGEVTCP